MKRFLPITLSLSVVLILILYLSFRVFDFFKPFLPFANYLLGVEKPTSYHVLLGNDAEMRANGGFAGSYAKITLSTPVIATAVEESPSIVIPGSDPESRKKPWIPDQVRYDNLLSTLHSLQSTISFQDIYVPNGQIKGLFVAPPEPIQQAFGHGTWELANADWEPDFPTAAKSLRWFLEKGGETNPDILAILNLSTIKKVLAEVGSFPVPEYRATLTPDNLYLFLQGKAELNFFPGSTQKKDALTAVGGALVKKIKSLSFIQKLHIAQILYTDFINQNIMVHSTNSSFKSFLEQEKLAGVFQSEAFDTYAMIESNLGANKANAFVTRQTTHVISLSTQPSSSLRGGEADAAIQSPELTSENRDLGSKQIHHQVTVKFINSSIEANPNPPLHYGGNYIAYLRLYVPENAQNISLTRDPMGKPPLDLKVPNLTSDNYQLSSKYGLTEIGFWHTTLAGNQSTVSLTYDLPLPDSRHCESRTRAVAISLHPDPICPYSLAILKQHGLTTSPQTINLFGKLFNTDLKSNLLLP